MNADEIAVGETIQRTTQSNPDIDLLKFTPTSSRYYTFTLTSEKNLFYEIADAAGSLLSPVTKDETDHFYLEKSNVYYIRIRGERDSAYTACMTGSLDEAVVWDFDDNTLQGFSVSDNGASVARHQISASDGVLTVTRTSEGDGGVFTPLNLKLPTEKYKYLVIGVNSASADSELKVYFDTTATYYAENDTVNAVINTKSIQIKKSDSYREYVVDLSGVENGWSTNYVGVLNQLMFSLKSNGTFTFDFIKLSNDNTIMIPSENTITFNTSEGKIHPIVVFSNQTPISANTVYIINYDRNALEIDDLCAFTFAKETTRGMIAGTSLEVISISPGEIQFKINSPENKIITGVLDCIIFKGLMVTSTTVSINRE